MIHIALINGPNLNLLGTREPDVYGSRTLGQIVESVSAYASASGFKIQHTQSNHEGRLVDAVQEAQASSMAGIIINPAAYSHSSIALRDAISAAKLPTIEVHLSNIYQRENFRHLSLISQVADGVISGLGETGYLLAVDALKQLLDCRN